MSLRTKKYSKEDAKRARKYEKIDAKNQKKMNEILHDAALTSLRNNDMERYEEYLESVVNWQVEPSSHPFYKAHSQSFQLIQKTNPSLYQLIAPSWNWRVQYVTVVWRTEWWISSGRTISTQPESFTSRIGWAFGELLWDIFPSIEQDPRKKQAWSQLGSIAVLWWSIYMWYKVISNLFGKHKRDKDWNIVGNKWLRAAWWWAALVALTNADKIVKWWANILKEFKN